MTIFGKSFLSVIPPPPMYSINSALSLSAIPSQNKLNLLRSVNCRPDNPEQSTFNGAEI